MLDYSHWPLWAQILTGLFLVLVAGTIQWFAWVRPAIKASAKSAPAGLKTIAVVTVIVTMILILGWAWLTTH